MRLLRVIAVLLMAVVGGWLAPTVDASHTTSTEHILDVGGPGLSILEQDENLVDIVISPPGILEFSLESASVKCVREGRAVVRLKYSKGNEVHNKVMTITCREKETER